MSETELKHCPFCGGEAERIELTDEENFGGSVICCKGCGASSPVHFDRKENLDDSWNRRTDAAPDMYAALEAMLVNPDKASREQARAALNRANNR